LYRLNERGTVVNIVSQECDGSHLTAIVELRNMYLN
jgi:hypothetical protein